MARVLDRKTIVDELKAGSEVRGDPIWGYHLSGRQYDGWTVRSDTLVSLLQKGLVTKEHAKRSHYYIYRWKR